MRGYPLEYVKVVSEWLMTRPERDIDFGSKKKKKGNTELLQNK